MTKQGLFVVTAWFMLVTCGFAEQQYQSHASIQDAIRDFLESTFRQQAAEYAVELLPLDKRLQLKSCERALEVFQQQESQKGGYASVGVRCSDGQGWTIYTQARIKVFKEVVVLRNSLKFGSIISSSDIEMTRREISQLHQGYLTAIDQAVNKQLRRTAAAGSVLSTGHLVAPKLVRRGQQVLVRTHVGQLDVNSMGEALMDGEAGQRIRVRNGQSGRIVEGVVIESGEVRIAF
jgi:flagella basal body P-ring formation protein FlgA